MFRSAIPILFVVVVVVGLLAWANPADHQKMVQYASRAGSGMNSVISAGARDLSGFGVQIDAYLRAHGPSGSTGKPSPGPAGNNVQAFFNALVQQIVRLSMAAIAWFKTTFHLAALARLRA